MYNTLNKGTKEITNYTCSNYQIKKKLYKIEINRQQFLYPNLLLGTKTSEFSFESVNC